jgi:hypothetical protein
MKLYHGTTPNAARKIQAEGFRDGTSDYLTSTKHTGVWLSDTPLDANEGATGGQVLEVCLPDDFDLSEWEWVEEGKPYREFMVPADRINSVARIRCLCAFCENGEERDAVRFVRVGFFEGLLCDECTPEENSG